MSVKETLGVTGYRALCPCGWSYYVDGSGKWQRQTAEELLRKHEQVCHETAHSRSDDGGEK